MATTKKTSKSKDEKRAKELQRLEAKVRKCSKEAKDEKRAKEQAELLKSAKSKPVAELKALVCSLLTIAELKALVKEQQGNNSDEAKLKKKRKQAIRQRIWADDATEIAEEKNAKAIKVESEVEALEAKLQVKPMTDARRAEIVREIRESGIAKSAA